VVNELTDSQAVNPTSGIDSNGLVSLRSAIQAANHLGGDQTIQFDPTVFTTPQTIKLTLGVLQLKGAGLTIQIRGPAAGVTISGSDTSEVFQVGRGVSADLNGMTISNGRIIGDGGGIFNKGSLTLNSSTISGNTALISTSEHGEGIYSYFGSGGGIFNKGSLTLNNSTISGNTAQWNGAGLYNAVSGTIELANSVVSGNSQLASPTMPLGYGGGINNEGKATISNCTISGNSTTAMGGGIFNSGTATLVESTVSGNSAKQDGGGVSGYDSAATTVSQCTISNNSAGNGGGLAFPTPPSEIDPATLINCTVTGNTATESGGGIYVGLNNYATIDNCTIARNVAIYGGIQTEGNLTLNNTIVASNTSKSGDGDLVGSVEPTSTGNLIGVGNGITGGITNGTNDNQIGTPAAPIRPLLAPLGNYGGPTQTMALLPGSPAIDAGRNAVIPANVTTDQRGDPRIFNGTVDVGAFESQGFTPVLNPATANVPADATSFPLVITGLGFDQHGTNTLTITDLTNPANVVTVNNITINSPTQLTAQVSGTLTDGDVLSASVTTDGASSNATSVAVVAPVLSPATTAVPANAALAPLVINGLGFDPGGTNTLTITDLTHPADSVTVNTAVAASASVLNVTISGTFTAGDRLSAVVSTDGASSISAPVARAAPVLSQAASPVPARASSARLVINGFGFDPQGRNAVKIIDLTNPADTVTIVGGKVRSATRLIVMVSGTFAPGDELAAQVTTHHMSSETTPVAIAIIPR
jgi:parallel beta-helix repeat protein